MGDRFLALQVYIGRFSSLIPPLLPFSLIQWSKELLPYHSAHTTNIVSLTLPPWVYGCVQVCVCMCVYVCGYVRMRMPLLMNV